ncbi:MAG: hypothetical protein AABX26_00010 [Nanoarchaeota archaeon]
MKNKKILKQKRFIREKEKERRMEEKTMSAIGIGIAIITGFDKIINFFESFGKGLTEFLNSLSPLVLLVLLIIVIWSLGHKK